MKANRIAEVSATVDAGLTQAEVDGMNEAERLALVVGAAYGQALAERDEARAQAAIQQQTIQDLVDASRAVLDLGVLEGLTWAKDQEDVDTLRAAVESVQAPETTED